MVRPTLLSYWGLAQIDKFHAFVCSVFFFNICPGGRKISDWTDKLGVRDGGWGWGSAFTDYDNDGDLDLFVTNGLIIPETTFEDVWNVVPNKFWQNDGKLNMKEIGADIGVDDVESGRGVSLIDFDGDGDQDIFVVNYAGKPRLYRNDGGNANDYIRIRVEEGNGQHSIGAIVKVTVGDVTQMRVIGVGEGFAAQSEAVAHFGLGKLAAGTEVEVKVQWPGKTTGTLTITNPKINSLINIKRPETGTASEDVDGQTGRQCSNVAGVCSLFSTSYFFLSLSVRLSVCFSLARCPPSHTQ